MHCIRCNVKTENSRLAVQTASVVHVNVLKIFNCTDGTMVGKFFAWPRQTILPYNFPRLFVTRVVKSPPCSFRFGQPNWVFAYLFTDFASPTSHAVSTLSVLHCRSYAGVSILLYILHFLTFHHGKSLHLRSSLAPSTLTS